MSKASEEFYLEVSIDIVQVACKNSIAQLGWRIMEEHSNKIVCKEIAVQITSFTWPAEVAINIFDNNGKTKILLDGSIFGFGPIQSNHLKGQMGRIRNLIETNSIQIISQGGLKNKVDSLSNELEKLAELHSKGILSDDEFKNAKNKLLNL